MVKSTTPNVYILQKLLQYYLEKFCQKNKFLIYTKKEKQLKKPLILHIIRLRIYRTQKRICTMKLFCENSQLPKTVDYFCRIASSQSFEWTLNTLRNEKSWHSRKASLAKISEIKTSKGSFKTSIKYIIYKIRKVKDVHDEVLK